MGVVRGAIRVEDWGGGGVWGGAVGGGVGGGGGRGVVWAGAGRGGRGATAAGAWVGAAREREEGNCIGDSGQLIGTFKTVP